MSIMDNLKWFLYNYCRTNICLANVIDSSENEKIINAYNKIPIWKLAIGIFVAATLCFAIYAHISDGYIGDYTTPVVIITIVGTVILGYIDEKEYKKNLAAGKTAVTRNDLKFEYSKEAKEAMGFQYDDGMIAFIRDFKLFENPVPAFMALRELEKNPNATYDQLSVVMGDVWRDAESFKAATDDYFRHEWTQTAFDSETSALRKDLFKKIKKGIAIENPMQYDWKIFACFAYDIHRQLKGL